VKNKGFKEIFFVLYGLAFATTRREYQKLPEAKLPSNSDRPEHSNHGIALKISARESSLHTSSYTSLSC